MAIPLVLPLLFTAASVAANTMGANKAAKATSSALAAERARQNMLDAEAEGLTAQSQGRYEDFQGQQDARESDLAGMFTEALDTQPAKPIGVLPQSSSNVVVQSDAAASEDARGDGVDRARRLAAFRGFGDLLGDTSRLQGRDAAKIGTIGSFKRGSQGVMPTELNAAGMQGAGMRQLGDLFNLAAGITTGPALAGGSFPGLNIGSPGSLFGGSSWS
jgi:hypothetical protein